MKLKLGVLFVCGLVWSCVEDLPVDRQGPGADPETTDGSEAVAGTKSGGGGSKSADPGGSGGSTSATYGGQSSSEVGGICPFDGYLEYDPDAAYPFCHGNELIQFPGTDIRAAGDGEPIQKRCRSKAPGTLEGAGRHAWTSTDGSPDGLPLDFCLCTEECQVDADCPAPESGTAEARCIDFFCHIVCDDGETCPNGMTCTQKLGSDLRVCMWGSRAPGCDTSEWPDVTPRSTEGGGDDDGNGGDDNGDVGGDNGEGSGEGGDICPFDRELEYDPDAPYPFCHGNELIQFPGTDIRAGGDGEPIQNRCRSKAPGTFEGTGRHAWTSTDGSPDGLPLDFCQCTVSCTTDADCPAPDSGTAEARCIEGFCQITCTDGETCPDGMTCTQDPDTEHRVCMWGSRGAGCDTSEWPNVTPPQ